MVNHAFLVYIILSRNFLTPCLLTVAHPNLVRLMGYATKEGLMLVQELMLGQALDKQLPRRSDGQGRRHELRVLPARHRGQEGPLSPLPARVLRGSGGTPRLQAGGARYLLQWRRVDARVSILPERNLLSGRGEFALLRM